MKSFAIILNIFCFTFSYSQSIDPKRVEKIQAATSRITIEGTAISGTGFFVAENGLLLTCFHVISPSIILNGNNVSFRKIYVTSFKGETFEYKLSDQMKTDTVLINACRGYDFAILTPIAPHKGKVSHLKLGKFENTPIGSEVFTAGYPLSLTTQFISKGILASKRTESFKLQNNSGFYTIKMNQGLLDLTMNPGNSGGAIIKVGKSIDDDRVIGLADFIINPMAPFVNNLTRMFQEASKYGNVTLMGIDPVEMYNLFTNMMANTSVGISGCVSIDHIIEWVNYIK